MSRAPSCARRRVAAFCLSQPGVVCFDTILLQSECFFPFYPAPPCMCVWMNFEFYCECPSCDNAGDRLAATRRCTGDTIENKSLPFKGPTPVTLSAFLTWQAPLIRIQKVLRGSGMPAAGPVDSSVTLSRDIEKEHVHWFECFFTVCLGQFWTFITAC